MLAVPAHHAGLPRRFAAAQPWDLADHVDHDLIRRAETVLAGGRPVELALPIDNARRAVGTLLSGEIARRHGARGLPDGAITVKFTGSAGQSLGAFLAPGVVLALAGDANDYVGKGMSGGRIAIAPPKGARFVPEDNVILGNVALYGATAGELFACGLAGERFAVRNSGARAVVEGVGDHGCEYMTGGVVVVLGGVGRNFAAGMSGGTAYVFDQTQTARSRTNLEMVELESLVDESDLWLLRELIEDHVRLTRSPLGGRLLDNWERSRRALRQGDADRLPARARRPAARRRRPPTAAGGGGAHGQADRLHRVQARLVAAPARDRRAPRATGARSRRRSAARRRRDARARRVAAWTAGSRSVMRGVRSEIRSRSSRTWCGRAAGRTRIASSPSRTTSPSSPAGCARRRARRRACSGSIRARR